MNYVRIAFILFLFIFSQKTWSNTAILKLNLATTVAHKGDVYQGVMEVHPVRDGERQSFYYLNGLEIENKIKILKIETIIPNANNVDVLEIHGLYMILEVFDPSKPLLLKALNRELPLRVNLEKVGNTIVNEKEFLILEQGKKSIPWSKSTKAIIFLIIFSVALLAYDKHMKKKKERLAAEQRAREFAQWNEIFKKAESREDFEKIYSTKEEWLKLVEVQTPAIIEFRRMMEEHQFKEEWTDNEKMDVKFTFDSIKGIFQ